MEEKVFKIIEEEIKKLEKERMDYLEADDNKTAGRIQSKINKLRNEKELRDYNKIKRELELALKFINKKGNKQEFEDYKLLNSNENHIPRID